MKFTYTTPKQRANGMWESEVLREDGWLVEVLNYTTKKRLQEVIRDRKKAK